MIKRTFVTFAFFVYACIAQAQSDVVNTAHNLSVSGPGPVKAASESRICVFCHTPHNAAPESPLWNKQLQPKIYDVYASPTLKAGPIGQPTGPTKLCLSCHDGTIAMGAVVNPATGISMTGAGTFPAGSLSNFGLNLSGHHPVSFHYSAALPNPELAASPPQDLTFGGTDELHCTTCHDPHDDRNGQFLAKDNRFSALCISCHQITDWATSKHATSTYNVVGLLPRPPKTWPDYTQMDEWACETCHTPHFAATPEELLNFTASPPEPFSCTSAGCHSAEPGPVHSPSVVRPVVSTRGATSTVGMADIAGQVRKVSAHHELPGQAVTAKGSYRAGSLQTGVACADCHNPHTVNDRAAEPPFVSGLLQGVSGVDRNGAEVTAVNYEYEICFKCHSDNTSDAPFIPRVISNTNTRQTFDPSNESYHPVIAIGRNLNVPSIPSTFRPGSTPSEIIYCSDCHADNNDVSRGPHGSDFPPILKYRYETTDNTPETFDNYELCYQCHDRSNILSDVSFQKKIAKTTATGGGHSGHLASGAPCSVCHDPHGVNTTLAAGQGTGSHSHLINFDTRVVQPIAGGTFPTYETTGPSSGTCTLVCHGVTHDHFSYP